MEQKTKHLEFIQAVINRMAVNSFLIKGWSITLVSALFLLEAKDANTKYIIIAYIPAIIFWVLDSYYLSQERLFRALYEQVRLTAENSINFSMDTKAYSKGKNTWIEAFFSLPLAFFHASLIAVMLTVMYLLN